MSSGRWISEVLVDAAGHIPIRGPATLSEHHDGLAGPLLARALIRNAGRTTATVGAATGGLAAVSTGTPATWGALPIELATETMIVVAVEMKLVGELHETAGIALPAALADKGVAVARAWAESRGIDPGTATHLLSNQIAGQRPGSLGAASPHPAGAADRRAANPGGFPPPGGSGGLAGAAADLVGRSTRDRLVAQLQRRLLRRAGRNATSLAPFLIGAGAGATLNRRSTRTVGDRVAGSLGLVVP